MAAWAALVSEVATFMEPIWAVRSSPRTTSGRHSRRAMRKPARRPVRQPQRTITTPPTRKRRAASQIGGASSSPILMATGLAPQMIDTSSASAAPRRSIGA
jgi:hypothetical protein